MGICRQMRVVLWKNFTIRRRRWPRAIFELIWPLSLFLILTWHRARDLPSFYDGCHNDVKYLGSTGFLPALQTYVCRWNNTCHSYPNPTDQFSSLDDNTTLWNVFAGVTSSLATVLNDEETVSNINQFLSQVDSINSSMKTWNGTIAAYEGTDNLNPFVPTSMMSILFSNSINLSNLHQSWFMNRTVSLPATSVAAEIYLASVQASDPYSYRSDDDIQQAFCVKGQFNQTFLVLNSTQSMQAKSFLCNHLIASDLKKFLIGVQEQLDEIFLIKMEPDPFTIALKAAEVMIVQTATDIRDRLKILNVSFPFEDVNNSFSLTTLCGGRHDFPVDLERHPSKTTQSPDTSSLQEVLAIDWVEFAHALLRYNASAVCTQTYPVGSGGIRQTVVTDRACRCVLFDQLLKTYDFLKPFSRLILPLLYGKIYYHPSNLHYDSLIQQINQTFESLDELVKLFRGIQRTIVPTYQTLSTLCHFLPTTTVVCQQVNAYKTTVALFTVLTEFLACAETNRFVAKKSEEEMVRDGQNGAVTNTFLAAIKFLDDTSNNGSLPKHVRYKLRMILDHADGSFHTEDRYFTYQPRFRVPWSMRHFSFSFIYLQNALDRAIIHAHTGSSPSYGIQTQQMPYPCWFQDKFIDSIKPILSLLMVLSWIFTVSMTVRDIVYEKEKRLKEIIRIMGLNDSVHWLTWFIVCTVVMLTTAAFLLLILKFGKITPLSNVLVLFLFFVCYTFATISQCFLISVFFKRANLAACGAGIIYFIFYLPHQVLVNYEGHILTRYKVVTCLSSTVAFALGWDYIARFEGMNEGIQWHNINRATTVNDNLTFLQCLIMMLVDSMIYILLTVYIENVFPGEYGIPQPWYYPLTKTYWFGYDAEKIRRCTRKMKEQYINLLSQNDDEEEEEDDREEGEVGVEVQHLSKYYGSKLALKNLSVKFYRNMITAFLGRNGAGKSTTWSILTGLVPPSSGTVYVDGYDILTDIKVIRKRLGFAPQHNILFDMLTVKEHLEFFSALKDTPRETIEQEVTRMLADLALENKSESYSTELSGGMKRKLSVAISFIGNSTTVILDEPTAGVDPFARRAIWDLILKYKPGRTIVLSTHHLDEAELLSDRLAIIASGELKCVGTTMDLKRKYGQGYNLIVELKSTPTEREQHMYSATIDLDPMSIELTDMTSSTRFEQLTKFLKAYIPDIRMKERYGDQVTYVIADDVPHTKIFPKMLADLDENLARYHVKSYGLSNSSLEQVFLGVADEIKRPEDYKRSSRWKRLTTYAKRHRLHRKSNVDESQDESIETAANDDQKQFDISLSDDWNPQTTERYTGVQRLLVQISGLLIKRLHRTKRNIKGFIAEILLPIIFILLAMVVISLAPNEQAPPLRILHPWYWDKPNYMFQSLPRSKISSLSKSVQETFTRPPSLGTRCMESTMLDTRQYPCDAGHVGSTSVTVSANIISALNGIDYNQTRLSPKCSCNRKTQVCSVTADGRSPSYETTQTKDILYRLSDYNISDWIVKTEYDQEYLMRRFGGIEFLQVNGTTTLELIDETTINQLHSLSDRNDATAETMNATKVASLFRVHVPQASVWYNNKGWVAGVAFVNVFNNALLRGLLLEQNTSASLTDYGITAINHPLPQTEIQLDSDLQGHIEREVFTTICVIFTLAFIPTSCLVFLIDERVTTSKHLQFVSGVKGWTYWSANFLWELTNYSVSIACCILIFLAVGVEAYVHKQNFLCLILLLFLYGFAIIPLMSPISYLFETPSTGFVLISCINVFIGLILTISTIALDTMDDKPRLQNISPMLKRIFIIFPHYCLGRGLFDMSKLHATNAISAKYIADFVPKSPLDYDLVGRNLLSLFIQGVVFSMFAILVQYRSFIVDRGCDRTSKDLRLAVNDDDNDVANERQRIYADRENASGDVLRMVDLVKVYGWRFGRKFTAVKQICTGVRQGECFGLLGINGSGKTTTFKMLTGEVSMTNGNAFVNNYSVIEQLDQVHQNLGYCPQFDALDSLLTAREHLYLYARLRGIKTKNMATTVDRLLKRLALTLWADRPVHQYSGGNKRKLSAAISLIGDPSIIFMDPTAGMDVRAKRFLWDFILTLTRQEQKSVIITSHSMEECETLCNRLVIMVNGEFRCLGSVQHLKAKFGDEYTMLLRTNTIGGTSHVIDYIKQRIPESTVKEERNRTIKFRVPTNVPLHRLFSILEETREELNNVVEDYTVTQVTLDDVFVNFARSDQIVMKGVARGEQIH